MAAQASLPETQDTRYAARPLSPPVSREIGLAVLDQRQSTPATLAFIEVARSVDFSCGELN